jgi:hypothetical protein
MMTATLARRPSRAFAAATDGAGEGLSRSARVLRSWVWVPRQTVRHTARCTHREDPSLDSHDCPEKNCVGHGGRPLGQRGDRRLLTWGPDRLADGRWRVNQQARRRLVAAGELPSRRCPLARP